MGILIDGDTKVICQGLTGATATRLSELSLIHISEPTRPY